MKKFTATISFDLKGAKPEKYEELYTFLEARHWTKKIDADSTMEVSFKEGVSFEDVVSIVKNDFKAAASAIKHENYSGEIAVGAKPVPLR